MIADFFTKPIQGKKFQTMQDIILNRNHASASQYRSVLGNSRERNNVTADRDIADRDTQWDSQSEL